MTTQTLNDIPTLTTKNKQFIIACLKQDIDLDFFTVAQAAGGTDFPYSQVYAAIQHGQITGQLGSVIHAGCPPRYFFK